MRGHLRLLPASLRKPLALAGLAATTVLAPTSAFAQPSPGCTAGQPVFLLGFAQLKQQLGASMGQPLDCEQADAGGNTVQHTTTGLAYYHPATGVVAFTDGWEHYALDNGQVLLWRNASVEPPQADPAEAAYVNSTLPMRARTDQLDQQLTTYLHQAQSGQLDDIAFEDLGAALDELSSVRDTFAAVPAPANLAQYAALWVQAQDADIAAGQALLQARLAQDEDNSSRSASMQEVGVDLLRRDQLRAAAQFAYSEKLAVAVTPSA